MSTQLRAAPLLGAQRRCAWLGQAGRLEIDRWRNSADAICVRWRAAMIPYSTSPICIWAGASASLRHSGRDRRSRRNEHTTGVREALATTRGPEFVHHVDSRFGLRTVPYADYLSTTWREVVERPWSLLMVWEGIELVRRLRRSARGRSPLEVSRRRAESVQTEKKPYRFCRLLISSSRSFRSHGCSDAWMLIVHDTLARASATVACSAYPSGPAMS